MARRTEAMAAVAGDLAPGSLVQARYRILRRLGSGGLGTTYLARDELWSRPVALKLVRTCRRAELEIIGREFDLLRSVFHPNLAQVHDLGLVAAPGGVNGFYTADYVDGAPLGAFAKGSSWPALQQPLVDALRALGHLHASGIRHGDFKPDNVLVTASDEPAALARGVLIDLSCARPIDQRPGATQRTTTESVAGTPGFIAPELLDGGRVDERADLYAVGITLRALVAALRSPAPPALEAIGARLVAPRADARPSSVDELLEALGEEPSRTHPVADRLGTMVGRAAALERAESVLRSLEEPAPSPGGGNSSELRHRVVRLLHVVGPDGSGRSRLLRELKWRAEHRFELLEASPRAGASIEALLAELTLGADRDAPLVAILDDAHRGSSALTDRLRLLARSLEPDHRVLLVVASDERLVLEGPVAERIAVGAIEPDEVAGWLSGALGAAAIEAIVRISRGMPGVIRQLLEAIAAGQIAEEDLMGSAHRLPAELRSSEQSQPADVDGRRSLDRLRDPERRVLALLVAYGEPLGAEELAALGVRGELLGSLVAAGLLTRGEAGFELGPRLRSAEPRLAAGERRAAHRAISEWLGRRLRAAETAAIRAEHAARCVVHSAEAGRPAQAAVTARDEVALVALAPNGWHRAALALDRTERGSPSPSLRLLVARILREAGHPAEAAERLGAIDARGLSPTERAWLTIERGLCALATSDLRAARSAFEALLGRARGPRELEPLAHAAGLVGRAQTELRSGGYPAAATAAATAIEILERPEDESVPEGQWSPSDSGAWLVDALGAAAIAASSLGERRQARSLVERALGILEHRDDPRRAARLLGARALIAYEAGELAEAARDHRRVLELVEQHGLRDRVANAALNLGTACHQQARWGEALESYRRGLRAALVGSQRTTATLLRFNLGKLYADLGQLERARHHAEQCRAAAVELGDGMLVAAADSLGADLALAAGDHDRARSFAQRARDGLDAHGSRREQAEIELALADIELGVVDAGAGSRDGSPHEPSEALGRVADHLARAVERAAGLDASDVHQRIGLARARLAARRGATTEAVAEAEAVVRHCEALGLVDLGAEAERWVGSFWLERGALALARKHESQARERWERTLADLPASFREAFWHHPRRARLAEPSPAAHRAISTSAAVADPAARRPTARELGLERLLAVNQRLNSTLETRLVLEQAMDAAIELSGAERGFLLLASPNEMDPAVARNFERASIDGSQQAFSRAIAAEVLASGEPLVTADARADARFAGGASVHVMNLKSVACVPVVSPRGVLGVLYLDHRYERGRFGDEDVGLLVAFATQVAIALDNARLHEELRQRNAELERERQRVEALARGQAEEIDRLAEEVRRTRIVRDHRFDYSAIVGRCRAIEEVLGVLDRVIDTDLPVLVQGESGTGKELVVRAIHHNSPRRARRLVAINCAALPENLLESELFGYERGAFTGADRARDGLVVQAAGGTLHLDEIGEMPKPMQAKLLRVLQEREVQPLGAARTVPVDFRLVCATNRRLRDEAAAGRFREDLYYRLSAVELELPPLRDRAEDIPELVGHLLARVSTQLRRPELDITPAALRRLVRYDWPGNVRQLEHLLTKAAALAEGGRIEAADVELPTARPLPTIRDARREQRAQEIATIARALADNHWNVTRVARLLGMARPTLYRRIRRYGLAPPFR